jgi:hypothetical protein
MTEPIVVSWSEIDTFRQCPFKHDLAYRQRWQSDIESPALTRGTAWHRLLEIRYEGQMANNPDDALLAINGLLSYDDGTQSEEQELLEWMYDGYCEMWDEQDQEWEVKAVEFKGFAPLDERFTLKVKIDLVAARRGRLWVWDHKSGKNLPYSKELDLDDQMGLYIWCMRQMGYPVAGAIYSAARTQRNKTDQPLAERFTRIPLRRTDFELDTIAREALATCYKMWPEGADWGELRERNTNTDTCRWKCGFTEACLSSRKGGRLVDMLVAHGYAPHPFRQVELEYQEWMREKANG